MIKAFSNSWNASKLPRKQRKYRYNAPLHLQGKFMKATLSKELREKYNRRNIRIRVGDKIKILRGQYKGKTDKIERINMKDSNIFVEKIEIQKKDGSKAKWPINPTNIMITELNTEDKKRLIPEKTKENKETNQKNEKSIDTATKETTTKTTNKKKSTIGEKQ